LRGASAPARRKARARALDASGFSRLVAPFAPFEPHPTVAVAVSGGADSMALALLAAEWAAARKGRAVALTVDHGLRPESAREARTVGRWLKARGMSHRVLTWAGPKPAAGIQAAARAARYGLLRDWCARHGVLHLFVAHTAEDQAETFLLRLERGSGPDGLSGMPAVAEGPRLRLLRPLLTVSKARLVATLKARGQPWIEDPSNENPGFARVRARGLLSALRAAGLQPRRIVATTRALARARAAGEGAVAACLAIAASPRPAGYVELDLCALRRLPPDIAGRVLARCLMAVSGAGYPPRRERLERLLAELRRAGAAAARTLAGCRIVPHRRRLVICREAGRAESRKVPSAGGPLLWDGRFLIALGPVRGKAALRLAPLGEKGWAEIAKAVPESRRSAVPAAVRPSLPALFDSRGVLAVPHLGFTRTKAAGAAFGALAWQPANPLTTAGFWVA